MLINKSAFVALFNVLSKRNVIWNIVQKIRFIIRFNWNLNMLNTENMSICYHGYNVIKLLEWLIYILKDVIYIYSEVCMIVCTEIQKNLQNLCGSMWVYQCDDVCLYMLSLCTISRVVVI